ncbi:unnamed protein product [Discosporangium mesarthrocarpum]
MMKVLRPSPQYMARLRHGAILAALVFNAVSGLRYDLEGELSTLSYSEGWMFGSERGPIWTENGPSFIDVDLNVTMSPMESASLSNVSLLFYGTEVMEFLDTNLNICGRQTQLPSNFQDVEMMSFPVKEVVSKEDGDVLHQAHVVAHHDVPRSGLQYAYFQICSAYRVVETQLYADGQVTFRNPYGYLQVTVQYVTVQYTVKGFFSFSRFQVLIVPLVLGLNGPPCFFCFSTPQHIAPVNVRALHTPKSKP